VADHIDFYVQSSAPRGVYTQRERDEIKERVRYDHARRLADYIITHTGMTEEPGEFCNYYRSSIIAMRPDRFWQIVQHQAEKLAMRYPIISEDIK
jgi:hypothetical protein